MNTPVFMEGIKRALVVSILARGWTAALGLLAVPVYLRFLGIEAYGLVGMFASFSVLVGFLDLGLGATLVRELARLSGLDHEFAHSRDVTRTFEAAYGLMAIVIGVLGLVAALPVAQHWIHVDQLDRQDVAIALALASVALACQWPANLYTSGLAGRHRQTQLSVATMLFASLRVVITLLVIWRTSTLQAFFWAQIGSALLHTLGLRFILWRSLISKQHRPVFRWSILRSSIGFAGGMTGIALTSIVLTQADKLILSNALSLSDFGVYVVAGTLATGLYMLISPLFSIVYPRFSTLFQQQDHIKIIDLYHTSSQTLTLLVVPVAAVVAVFSEQVLYVWTGNPTLSTQGAWVLAFLIIGNACNGIMNIPFALQLASGWTQLSVWMNVGAIALLAPAVWWAANSYGAAGGAAVWAVLNFGYIVLTPNIMHRRLLTREKITWYREDVVIPVIACAAVLAILYSFPMIDTSRVAIAFTLIGYWGLAALTTALVLPKVRKRALGMARESWVRGRVHQLPK